MARKATSKPGSGTSQPSATIGFEATALRDTSAEDKNGGQVCIPSCIMRCLVEMLSPCEGSIYDQESNATTRRLAVMNFALHGIEADFGPEYVDNFRRDLRTDYVLANTPFYDSDSFRNDDDVRLEGKYVPDVASAPQTLIKELENLRRLCCRRLWIEFSVRPLLRTTLKWNTTQ